jgi:exopolysaccharide biosynthesis polyprenyl glycosylphosphotransferase
VFLSLRLYRLILTLLTYCLPWIAFEAGYQLWLYALGYADRPAVYSRSGHLGLLLLCSFVWAFMSARYRVISLEELFRERTGIKSTLSALVATSSVLFAILFFNREDDFPRGLFLCDIFALFTITLLLRFLLRETLGRWKSRGTPTSLLIIGADSYAHQAAESLQRLSFAPCQIAGYVVLPDQDPAAAAGPLYSFDEIEKLNAAKGFQEVIIAVNPLQFARLPAIVEGLEKLCLPARAIVDPGTRAVTRERLFQLGRMQVLDLTTSPADLLHYALLKRAFDIFFSLLVLAPALPLFGLVALSIGITSRGPVFFAQERIGLHGQRFRMYKFRTMRVSARQVSDTVWSSSNNPRTTRLGSFLRRTNIDELPQFINVLKGDMSVVGPRPERPYFVDKFLGEVRRYNRRHALKVGITGWAQVRGWRGDTSIEKRLEHDLYYLRNWSFVFDLRIVAMTVLSTLTSRQV